jgi:hypothetical protein
MTSQGVMRGGFLVLVVAANTSVLLLFIVF